MILGGDIGGTKVNLGLFSLAGKRLQLQAEAVYPSKGYARFEDVVRDFLSAQGGPVIERAAFGIAGPVRGGVGQLTNLPWKLEAAGLAADLKLGMAWLLNDLEANAWGLVELPPGDFETLNAGDPAAVGNQAIISAGTGLGEAGLFWDGRQHHPFACEGGHSSFAPITELDAELFDFLHQRGGHVSWEKVLSGAGLVNIYQFLKATGRGAEPEGLTAELAQGDPAAVISRVASEGGSSRCTQALAMFLTYYGAEAGNLALKLMATGGVFIGGGIAPKILPQLRAGSFLQNFFGGGRMRGLLEGMPVRVVLNPKTALLGAAHYAAFGPPGPSEPGVFDRPAA